MPLDIEEEMPVEEQVTQEENLPTPDERSLRIDDSNQQVITPEETEQHLQNIEQQKKAERTAREKAEKEKQEKLKKEQEIAKIKQQAPSTTPTANNECKANQCLYQGKCWSKPAQAVCSPQDPINAWVCKDGYIDTGKSCVKKSSAKATTTKTAEKKVSK